MKQRLYKCLFIIVFGMTITDIHALETDNPRDYTSDYLTRDYYNYSTVSARVTDMFHYGEFQTSLFTGRLQVSIPIYSIDDPDFMMNIALHYNAEGFKPRKHSGYVGYNWFLEAGGCITREVNGYPDEIIGYSDHYINNSGFQNYPKIEGMYHYIVSHPESENMDKNEIFNLPQSSLSDACVYFDSPWHNIGDSCEYEVDYMPDIFHFDFLGYKGAFMINNSGKVRIISGDYVDVDLSGILANWEPRMPLRLLGRAYPMYPKENSTITIRTNDGYTYIFGGDLSKLEYTVNTLNRSEFLPSPSQYDDVLINPPTVSTWHLAEVIAPNMRTITYYYKPAKKPDQYDLLYETLDSVQNAQACFVSGTSDPLWEFNEYVNRFYAYNRALDGYYQYMLNKFHVYDNIAPNILYNYYYALDFALLAKTPEGNSYYLHSATKTCVLDSIIVSGEQPLRIIFDNSQESTAMYDPDPNAYGENSKRNYQLDAIHIRSSNRTIKTINLSYINKGYSGFPSYNWRLLSSAYISGVGTYLMNYHNGSYPNLSSSNPNYTVGSGESNEADDYGYHVGNNDSIALLQKLTYPTGGYQTYSYERYRYDKKRKFMMIGDSIAEMNTVNESGQKRGVRIKKVKTYDKLNHQVETRSYAYSNGIYFDNLYVYGLADDLYPGYGWPVRFRANYTLSAHIGYGTVIEEVTNTNGAHYKTIYRFDMGENHYTSQNASDMLGSFAYGSSRFGALKGAMPYSNKLRKWGMLKSVENYGPNNLLLKSTDYEYNEISGEFCDTIVSYFHDAQNEMSKKLYLCPDLMTRQIIKEYSQGDSLVTSKYYMHDRRFRLKKETVEDSRGIQHFTKYFYPDDIPGAANMGSFTPPLCLMILGHRVGTPVETISGYISGHTEYITGGTIDIYKKITYPVNNELVVSPRLFKTLSLSLSEPTTTYQPMSVSNGEVSYDPRYNLDCEYEFDMMYRPILIKPFGKAPTSMTWDGIYMTSQTKGNQIWTYTYIPHVGVSSMTDPRGITTYYTYDSAGRLVEEYQLVNENKQILNVYQYHIKTE